MQAYRKVPQYAFLMIAATGCLYFTNPYFPWKRNDRFEIFGSYDKDKDPPIDMEWDGRWTDINGRSCFPSIAAKRTLVVAIGDCESCSIKSYQPGMENPSVYERVVIVVASTKDHIRRRYKGISNRYVLVEDYRENVHQRLNAAWRPRFYSFSAAGRLVSCQGFRDSGESFLRGY